MSRRTIAASIFGAMAAGLVGATVARLLELAREMWPWWWPWPIIVGGILFIVALLLLVPPDVWTLPKRSCAMFKNWRYWRCYHPDYGIEDERRLVIDKAGDRYRLRLHIALWCQNRDDIETLQLNCESLEVRVRGRKLKGRKQTYCVRYDTGVTAYSIQPTKTLQHASYRLIHWGNIRPRLGKTARCQVENIGTAGLKGISRVLKIRKPFDIEVHELEWEADNTGS